MKKGFLINDNNNNNSNKQHKKDIRASKQQQVTKEKITMSASPSSSMETVAKSNTAAAAAATAATANPETVFSKTKLNNANNNNDTTARSRIMNKHHSNNNNISNIINNNNNNISNNSNISNNNNINNTTNPTSDPVLPYMEIREEYDKNGKKIKAEALNVSHELRNLQRDLKYKKAQYQKKDAGETKSSSAIDDDDDDDDDDEEGMVQPTTNERSEIVNALLENLQPLDHGHFQQEQHKGNTNPNTNIHSISPPTLSPTPPPLLDEPKKSWKNYNDISTRLDELILLEGAADKSKVENNKSSKQLRGKGWAKGFFDTKKQKSKPKQKSTPSSSVKKVGKESHIPPVVGMNESSDAKSSSIHDSSNGSIIKPLSKPGNDNATTATTNTTAATDIDTDNNGKKVQFKTTHDVQEIPRIGTQSVSDLKNPTIQHKSRQINNDDFVQRETVPIGGVIERQHQQRQQHQHQHQHQQQRSTLMTSTTVQSIPQQQQQPQKKMSRFAQRRQQLKQ